MPRLPTLALLLIALLAAPSASAGWFFQDPITVTIGDHRVGDRLLYLSDYHYQFTNENEETEEARGTARSTLLVEGPSRAVDRFGIERDTIAYVTEYQVEEESGQQRCHMLAGGIDGVRMDFLSAPVNGWEGGAASASHVAGIPISSTTMVSEYAPVAAYPSGPCAAVNTHQGRVLREGETISFGDLFGGLPWISEEERDHLSKPAIATDFHGRPALRIEYDLGELARASGAPESVQGTAAFTFADGLPSIVRETYAYSGENFGFSNTTLAGYEAGEGAAIPVPGGARLPERNEDAGWIDDARTIDTTGLTLEMAFADAYAAVLNDPKGELKAWFAAHPDALLMNAGYQAESARSDVPSTQTEWQLMWSDATGMFGATVTRQAYVLTPLGDVRVPTATPPTVVTWSDGMSLLLSEGSPEPVLDGPTLARVAAGGGVDPAAVRSLSYWRDPASAGISLSTVDARNPEGRLVFLNATAGALEFVASESQEYDRSGLLALDPPGENLGGSASSANAFSALAGPVSASDLGLPAAAATGVALLVIALKFLLVPLFTRLRRDRLLDNEVRARIYERVRAEPGIHRAELVDFAGIGEGATRHHLQQLVAHKLLVELDDGGFVRYFAAGEVPPDVARREMALRAGSQRRVYDLYVARPDVSLREAGAILGMSAPSVHRAKRKLEKAGLLPAAAMASVTPAEA